MLGTPLKVSRAMWRLGSESAILYALCQRTLAGRMTGAEYDQTSKAVTWARIAESDEVLMHCLAMYCLNDFHLTDYPSE